MTASPDFDARATYGEAAGDYEEAVGDYWGFVATRTLELLDLKAGERVLDAPCGTGVLLTRAADAVGADGPVLGIDVAPEMLAIARERVAGRPNVTIRLEDMTTPPPGPFDAIACVLGLFFVDDMPSLVRDLVARLSGGGRLVIGVFGEDFYRPLIDVFRAAVQVEAPDVEVIQPWARTATRSQLTEVLDRAGVGPWTVESQHLEVAVDAAGWRRIVRGSGLRRTLNALGPGRADRVLRRCDEHFDRTSLDRATVSARYVIVRR